MATLVTRSGKGSPLTHAEVDANFTNLNTDKLELSGGTMTGNLSFGDNDKAIFGAGSDLQIYHESSSGSSYVKEGGTGNLYIQGSNLILEDSNGGNFLYGTQGGDVRVYHNGSVKLATTSTGIDVTGNATFADNGKAIFGAGSDLQIYHDSSTNNSVINESGSGNLTIQGNELRLQTAAGGNYFRGVNGGASSLFYSNTAKLATTSTGIDVTGTVTADQLTVYNGTSDPDVLFRNNGTGDVTLTFRRGAADDVYTDWSLVNDSGTFKFISDNSADPDHTQLTMSQGDISFYEDTGTTAKFFWDASAESLGIGTTSPSNPFEVIGSVDTNVATFSTLGDGGGASNRGISIATDTYGGSIRTVGSGVSMGFDVNGSERMRIDSSGNVGIGTTSPLSKMHIEGGDSGASVFTDTYLTVENSGNTRIAILSGTTGTGGIKFGDSGLNRQGGIDYIHSSDAMTFATTNAERMRIDSSGNLLVGTTNVNNNADDGIRLKSDGTLQVRSDNSGFVATLNRSNASDGDILTFAKSNSTVGSIGTHNADSVYIGTGDTGLRFYAGGDAIFPYNTSTNASRDAAITLGSSTLRFKDLYLSGGVIGTAGARIYSSETSGSGLIVSAGVIYPSGNTGATANGQVDLGSAGVKFKDLYLSGGVYLGGTGAANHLDDYEEGTWTPSMGGTTTNPTVSYSSRSGKYTKIGRIVHLNFYISISSYSGGSGLSIIQGMPFGAVNEDAVYFYYGGGSSKSIDRGAIQSHSGGRIVLGQDNAGGINFINCSDMVSGGGLIIGNVTYETS